MTTLDVPPETGPSLLDVVAGVSMKPVASEFIAEVGYLPLAGLPVPEALVEAIKAAHGSYGFVLVKFHRGDLWGYVAPSGVYGLLQSGTSIGKAYNRILKGSPGIKLN